MLNDGKITTVRDKQEISGKKYRKEKSEELAKYTIDNTKRGIGGSYFLAV